MRPAIVRPARETTGILSGRGTEPVHVTVHIEPVPSAPPGDLAGQVVEVRDRDGALLDWQLVHDPGVEQPERLARIMRFRSWRQAFAVDRFIGERAFVLAAIDWADRHCDASALHILRLSEGYIPDAKVLRLRWQLDRIRARCSADAGTGFGIFAPPERTAPARGLLPTDPPTTVLANADAEVLVGPAGLQLRTRGSGAAIDVTGWRVDARAVVAQTSDGVLELDRSPAAELLCAIGQDAPQVAVRPVELRRLFASLLTFLADAADLAAECRTGLHVRSGWGVPPRAAAEPATPG